MEITIYKITAHTGIAYIGQTENYKERIRQHCKKSSNCTILRNMIQKYGIQSMKIEILTQCEKEQADDIEKEMIKTHNTLFPNGMNLTGGGETKKVISEETKSRMSLAAKKFWHDLPNHIKENRLNLRDLAIEKATGSIKKKCNKFKAYIPKSWTTNQHTKRYIGSFDTMEDAKKEIEKYRITKK